MRTAIPMFLFALAALASGCANSVEDEQAGAGICDGAASCFELCVCTTRDIAQCSSLCAGGGGAAGGGTGGAGTGGAGTGGEPSGGGAGGGSAASGGAGSSPGGGGSSGGGGAPGGGGSSGGGGSTSGPSCAGQCGSSAPIDNSCFCDAQCAQFGDCCSDYQAVCGGGGSGGSSGGGSGGSSGGGSGGGSGTACADDGSGWSSSFQQFECQVLDLVNQRRAAGASCGGAPYPPVGPVAKHGILTTSARAHAKDMGDKGYFSHTNLQGESPFVRMKKAGYSGSTMGENIAAGQPTPASVVDGWMKSSGHCKNIMNGKFKQLGVGYYLAAGGYKHYWVQNFGG